VSFLRCEMKLILSFRSRFRIVEVKHDPYQRLLKLNSTTEWQSVSVYPKVLRLVSRANAKIFVGNGLHESEEWIDITSNVGSNPVNTSNQR
jgi:hypothetical protein